ncbi:MAG: hypothetical protein HYS26_01950 [Candidatus Kaiserbacteria bacterium]|nr:MAG: hypothetical protein HYS26_01950 [Candidatus Kaiserbacteria bacterium]
MQLLTGAVKMAYELAFLLLLTVIVFAPFHAASTAHLPIVQTIDESRGVLAKSNGLQAGERLPLYRFNYSTKTPIGTIVVERVEDDRAIVALQPSRFSLGMHGKIVQDGEDFFTSLGADFGVSPDQYLTIFRGTSVVGQAHVVEVEANRSRIDLPRDIGPLEDLHVSEFGTATQVAKYDDSLLSTVEAVVIGALAVGYFGYRAMRRRSPLIACGEYIRTLRVPKKTILWVVNIAGGIPFSWFLGTMPVFLFSYLTVEISRLLFSNVISLRPQIDSLVPFSIAAVGIGYYAFLFWKRRSPILAFWQFLSYKGTGVIKKVGFARGFTNWALHLVIVYFFALTLVGFLAGDIAAVRSFGWPPPSLEAFFEQAKYALWAITVAGCLIGYGFSVVSILWGRYIRSLDFTVTGWLTNGFNYPLFGVVIWQMTPSFTGADPIVTAGPLLWLVLVLGLFFNLLYTLSILNLWTMFDLMTDKGVRSSFFYRTVRHPNYALEAGMFFVTELVGLSAGVHWLAILMFFFLYWIRSEREDNFMQYSNPDYAPYQKAVPWKFVPGVY